MTSATFRLLDLHRIMFGNAPWFFLLEVWLRTAVTYCLLVGAMRFLGRRVAAQFTLFEISIVVTLAAAIGVPLQASGRGLLPPFLIAFVVILLHRAFTWFGIRHRRLETLISTDIVTIVRCGVLQLDGIHKTNLGRKKVFELLRLAGYQHLGQITRAYMEPSGSVSIVRAGGCRPGLSVIPDFDGELVTEARALGHLACRRCGNTVAAAEPPEDPCPVCAASAWLPAVHQLDR